MADVKESKVDSTFTFRLDNSAAEAVSGPFEGQLHLFEHQYDKYVAFWYGYAKVLCTYEDYLRAMTESERHGIFHTCVEVEIVDGRIGYACVTYCKRVEHQVESESLFFGLVGFTPLAAGR
jgi:hypothetical protein